ncbi:MAG: bifunctional demethylmenaquinone methyltransferase/2-methoxy-6-polyprenyl-1,4-benzoquinol methylase UbiE [Rhodospirillaceae bacterium]|nr:bifunctional demethylmenaquinone methyltransferase/2-methoxy-6-polyprenyl-1,4-benzoquinol methylase UbiE [Rhodospirillaceae bacterium]
MTRTPAKRRAGAAHTDHASVDFGFRQVPETEKASMVRAVFDAVAPRYDLMNDLMSAGVHRLWKAALIDWLDPRPGETFLDVAGGTGDIAERIRARTGDAVPPVVVCDINAEMLRAGRDRALDRGRVAGLAWTCGDAEALPFPDMSFDAYTIAFGLRNVTHIDRALAEARRVLKPGGRFACLEFSRVVVPGLDTLYDAYSFTVLPRLGQWVAGDRAAYQYLAESIRRFPDQGALLKKMAAAGFAQTACRNLSAGVAALHTGWRV